MWPGGTNHKLHWSFLTAPNYCVHPHNKYSVSTQLSIRHGSWKWTELTFREPWSRTLQITEWWCSCFLNYRSQLWSRQIKLQSMWSLALIIQPILQTQHSLYSATPANLTVSPTNTLNALSDSRPIKTDMSFACSVRPRPGCTDGSILKLCGDNWVLSI